MTIPKRSKTAKRVSKPKASEYRFKIDAYTPETIPMARLAEYMTQLAEILGEKSSVHFTKLEAGSCVLVSKVAREAIPKIKDRATAIRRGNAPRDALAAYRTVNRMLRDDNGSAVLRESKRGATILKFPGREEKQETFPTVRQFATVQGFVIRVGGTDETVPVLLEADGQPIAGCYASRAIAKQLAQRLFDPVRLNGQGTWSRDVEGVWSLQSFRIDSFDWLENDMLSKALENVRAVASKGIPADAFAELEVIRHGPKRSHGRS